MKKPSLLALTSIIEQLDLSAKLKADFAYYLKYINLFGNSFVRSRSPLAQRVVARFGLNKAQRLDFPEMVKAWPVIAEHLYQRHNFYDRLEDIVLENTKLNLSKLDERNSPSPSPSPSYPSPSVQDSYLESKEDREATSPQALPEEKDLLFEQTRAGILKVLANYQKAWFKSDDRIRNVNKLIESVKKVGRSNEQLFTLLDAACEAARKSDAQANFDKGCCFFKRNLTGSRYQAALDKATDLIVRQYI